MSRESVSFMKIKTSIFKNSATKEMATKTNAVVLESDEKPETEGRYITTLTSSTNDVTGRSAVTRTLGGTHCNGKLVDAS